MIVDVLLVCSRGEEADSNTRNTGGATNVVVMVRRGARRKIGTSLSVETSGPQRVFKTKREEGREEKARNFEAVIMMPFRPDGRRVEILLMHSNHERCRCVAHSAAGRATCCQSGKSALGMMMMMPPAQRSPSAGQVNSVIACTPFLSHRTVVLVLLVRRVPTVTDMHAPSSSIVMGKGRLNVVVCC